MQRADHRGHSEDKQDVEQVGADGIAQRQPAVSLFRGNDGGHQLRQGGADGDNGQSDEILADTKIRSYDAGFIYHQIPTEDNGRLRQYTKSCGEERGSCRVRPLLCFSGQNRS